MIENGWVLTVDRDYAKYCGEEAAIAKADVGDGMITDFIYEKNLSMELGRKITGLHDPEDIVAELIEMLRDEAHKKEVEKAEYELVYDEYSDEFDKYVEELA